MAKGNGTWKVISIVGGFIVIVVGSAIARAIMCNTVTTMAPEVKKNTEHRIKFEERVQNMDKKIDKILEEVQKKRNET